MSKTNLFRRRKLSTTALKGEKKLRRLWNRQDTRSLQNLLLLTIHTEQEGLYHLNLIKDHIKSLYREILEGFGEYSFLDLTPFEMALLIWEMPQINIQDLMTEISPYLDSSELFRISWHIETKQDKIHNYLFASKRLTIPEVSASTVSFFYPLETEQRIIDYITTAKSEAPSLVHNILDKNRKLGLNTQEWDNLFTALIRTYKRIFMQLNKSESYYFEQNESLGEYFQYGSRLEQVDKAVELTKKIVDKIKDSGDFQEESFNIKLVQYIKDNYQDPNLALIDIADNFKLSPTYISRIFKEHAGRNFKDLLSLERVRACKDIIQADPTIKLNVLTTKSGFNNSATLIRTFKKYTGISPGKYAEQFK